MEITVRSIAGYRDLFGAEKTVEIPGGATVLDVLILFAGYTPKAQTELFENGVLKRRAVLMYNGERIDSEDAAAVTVDDGGELVLYPPVSGG